MASITTTVEMKQVLAFVDGTTMFDVDGFAVQFVDQWDNISADVLQSQTFRYTRGMDGILPTDCVASPGTFEFHLDNSAYNSASKAGYYSVEHTNTRDGFEMGTEVRVKDVYSSSTGYPWRGRIYDIYPEASAYQPTTRVTCYDWMKETQEQRIKGIEVATDQRGDQCVSTVIGVLPNSRQPDEQSLDTGQSTFPTVFDGERDEKTTLNQIFQKIAQSELGKIYVNSGSRGEQLVFENRHHGVDESTVQYDFDDSIASISTTYPSQHVKTRIESFAYPREVDSADVVLAAVQKSFSIAAGATIVIQLLFRDPDSGERISASSLTAQVSGTDYVANAQEDGGGANKTANLTVTETERSGNSITYTLGNTDTSTIWVTTFQQQGKGIYMYDRLPYVAQSSTGYYAMKGEKTLRFDMPLEDNYAEVVNYTDYLLSVWEDPICHVTNLTFFPSTSTGLADAYMDIDLGSRITINLPQIGIDQDYFVRKKSVALKSGLIECKYNVAPARSTAWCQLDDAVYGELDSTYCRIGL